MRHCKLFAVLIALLVVACEDELVPRPEASEVIGYSVSVNSNDWQARTRSADSLRLPRITIEPLEQKLGGKPLYLHTVVENSIPNNIKAATDSLIAGTRGTIVMTGDVNDLSVSAYVSNNDTWSDAATKLYMQNVKSTSSNNWTTNHFWPTSQKFIRFFAYSPVEAVTDGLTTTQCPPTFSYTVSDAIQKQTDLLVASAQYSGAYCQPAHLEFGHALTAVTIKLKEMDQFTIKSLTLSGVKKSGTYTYSYDESSTNGDSNEKTATHDAGTWDTSAGTETATYIYYFGTGTNGELVVATEQGDLTGYTYSTGAGEVTLNEGELTLLLMPQVLTEDAKITVIGTDHIISKEVDLTATIGVDSNGNAKAWEKGKHVTYTLSLSDQTVTYVFNVEEVVASSGSVTASTVPWYGATGLQYKVTDSYKIITRGGNQSEPIAVPWRVNYPTWVDETTIPGETLQDGIVSNSDGSNAVVGTYGVVTTNFEAISSVENFNSHMIFDTTDTNPEKGTSEIPYDLSTEADYSANVSPKNTANCYMVSAIGYYTFPLVYGNAITDGKNNTSSYSPGISVSKNSAPIYNSAGTDVIDYAGMYNIVSVNGVRQREIAINVLSTFLDHNDKPINGPWIVKSENGQGYKAASAEIIWQDEPCLLTEVSLNETKDYINFRVRRDCATEGNAVIAVKNAQGTIMWSWHIWVTDNENFYDNGKGIVIYKDAVEVTNRKVTNVKDDGSLWEMEENTFAMLRAHIGHCDGETKTYTGRTGSISFAQIDDGKVIESDFSSSDKRTISIVQGGSEDTRVEVSTGDNAVYYQWGRKDPMPGGLKDGKEKTCYNHQRKKITDGFNGGGIKAVETEAASLGVTIQNPNTFYHRTTTSDGSSGVMFNNWLSGGIIYYNLWNAYSNRLPMLTYFYRYEKTSPHEFFTKFTGEGNILELGVTKTIYDPCPPGYEMPRMDAFTGFTYDGIRKAKYFDKDKNLLADRVNALPESISEHANTFKTNAAGEVVYENDRPVFVETTYSDAGYNGISFYTKPMEHIYYYRRSSDDTFFVQAMGYRGSDGRVANYNNYGGALTATPICVQWHMDAPSNDYFLLQPSRLCFIFQNLTTQYPTLRPISTSDFDYAFSIMPAKTNHNPIVGKSTWTWKTP